MLISVPLGLISAAGVLVAAVGAALSVVWIGVPVFSAAIAACRWTVGRDRRAANALLGAHIPSVTLRRDPSDRPARAWLDVLADRQLTRMLTLCAIKLPVALAMLVLAAVAVGATAGLLYLGIRGLAGVGDPIYLGPVKTSFGGGLLMCLFAVPVAVLTVAALGTSGTILRTLVRSLLLSPQSAGNEPVREMLAESLGDRTLSIAYWLPDREIFVDETGRAVTLPEPGSGRAWTAVERDGRRVAAILHAAELDTGRELVDAAAAAAALALDNERLKADLRARVEDLRVSRVRIVEAGDAARRRIERDLHDGAQQHLVSLALDLRMLKAELKDPAQSSEVDALIEKLAVALDELRELARGIHPVVLTAQGLGPAVRTLAERSPVDTDARIEVGEERLPPAIEAAAYFVVSEALTNVGKYAQASRATVAVRRTERELVVEVRDDGVGGADVRVRDRPARPRGPPRRARRDAADREPARPRHARGGAHPLRRRLRRGAPGARPRAGRGAAMSRAVRWGCCLALLLAGCGGAEETVREPDLVVEGGRPSATAEPQERDAGRRGDAIRIAVVTHGQASSPFWVIVRNGIDAAARQLDASVSYRSPDTYSVPRMEALIAEAVATRPDGLVVSIPSAGVAGPIRRAIRAGIPVVSINSGSERSRALGALAHVGQPEYRAGLGAGRRLARAGVRRGLCVNHEVGNAGLAERCRGFARALRRAGGTAKMLPVNVQDRANVRRVLADAIRDARADGVLTLNTDAAEASVEALGARANKAVRLATFDLSPTVLEQVRAGQIAFAVDQQAYLQGYLPIMLLAQRIRYGLFPGEGEVVATGPSFVTRATAPRVLQLSRRGIR